MTDTMNRGTLWTVVERFHNEPVTVEISRATGYGGKPRFAIRVGWKSADRQGPWIPVDPQAEGTIAGCTATLIASAEAYVEYEMGVWQEEEDARVARANDELLKQREINAQKKQKYLQNKEQRKMENRQRSQGKGKGK